MAPAGEQPAVSRSGDVLRRGVPPVPARLAERAAAWPPDAGAATPRDSASVVLLRERPDASRALETYLLHRHARMAFAASMVVFPGGTVDPLDHAGADVHRTCAVRETAEETGVVLDPDALRGWAEWTTPVVEPRRFHTVFFVAELPPGQQAADVSGETDTARWWEPGEALRAYERAEIALMPPTWSILIELAEAGTPAGVLAAARERLIEPVLPQVVPGPDGWRFVYFGAESSPTAPSGPGSVR